MTALTSARSSSLRSPAVRRSRKGNLDIAQRLIRYELSGREVRLAANVAVWFETLLVVEAENDSLAPCIGT